MKLKISHLSSKRIFVLILTVSVCLRVASSIYLGDRITNLPGTFDQVSYHSLALRVLGGYGFSFGDPWWPFTAANQPTAHWSFLYTFYLVLVYSIFGPHPIVARLIQAIIVGILHPYLAYQIGKRVFNPFIGLLAALLTAIYIYFVYYSGTLMTEPFYITAILASLYCVIRLAEMQGDRMVHEGWRRVAAGLGISLAAAVLFRQIFLVVIPFIYLWMWWVSRGKTTRIPVRAIYFSGLILVLSIIPFTIYNYLRFDRFVLLNTNAGYAFYWANHPIYGTRFVPILTQDMGSYQDLVPVELRSLDEAALDNTLLRLGIKFIVDDPWRYLLLSASRVRWYFMFWPAQDSGQISNLSRVFSFGLYLPFMVYGMFLSLKYRPKKLAEFIGSPATLLMGLALIYSLIHIFSWTLIRYRLPVDALMIIFAGLAVGDLVGRLGLRPENIRKLNNLQSA